MSKEKKTFDKNGVCKMKRTSYIFNLNREVSLIDLDWILIDECGKGNWEASIDMAEGDYLWLKDNDENDERWRTLGKEKTFDRAYVVIEYEEWDDPRSFIENVKANIQERTEEEIKEVEEEIEVLEVCNTVNDEIEAIEYSNEIIEIEDDNDEDEVDPREIRKEVIDDIVYVKKQIIVFEKKLRVYQNKSWNNRLEKKIILDIIKGIQKELENYKESLEYSYKYLEVLDEEIRRTA